jgi:hypothetical protein
MSKNCGKEFEKQIRQQFESIPDVSVDRINDNVGFAGAYNIADLIVYRRPHKLYLECKTIKGTSFPFSNINQKALTDLVYQDIIPGVGCYFLIWFIDLDLTICVNATEIYLKMHGQNKKSIGVGSFKDFDYIEVEGTKKRKYYKYNLVKLLNELDGEIQWRN